MAAAAVITLAVLPGSNTLATGMSVVSATLAGWAGLNDGDCAMARIFPVLGCMMTTVQLLASVFFTSCAQACSASHCRLARMVSRTLSPGTICRVVCPATGMGWSLVPTWTSCWPARPASSELSDCSMPASPVSTPAPLVLVKPMRLAARSPFGYSRV